MNHDLIKLHVNVFKLKYVFIEQVPIDKLHEVKLKDIQIGRFETSI